MLSADPVDRPLPFGHTILGIFALSIFGLYGLTTLLYVSPNNPIRIYFDSELELFEGWGYQRWGFFAPPPTSNDRLYFAFSPKSGDGETIEVLQGIAARKQQDHPFNVKVEVVDYAVSGFASQVSDQIREVYRYQKVHELFDGDPAYLTDLALKSLRPDEGAYGRNIRILLRYAAMIAAERGIELDGLKCQMALTSVPLRPFTQRYNSDFPIDEELMYKTAILAVPKLTDR